MRPMLAGKPDSLKDLRFPLLGSPKFDGIRALVSLEDVLVSRRLTPIKNKHLQNRLSGHGLTGLDGELFLPLHLGDFHTGSGYVRSQNDQGANLVQFHAFDDFTNPRLPFHRRLEGLSSRIKQLRRTPSFLGLLMPEVVEHELLENLDDLLGYEERVLALSYEWVMLRHPDGPYKFGRSTLREHWLLKLKRFTDAEARVVGFEEQMHNGNEATIDALGKTKRSKHKENMTGKGTLGAFIVVGLNGRFAGKEFRIATGSKAAKATPMDDAFRKDVWEHQMFYLSRRFTYTYFEPGSKDAPRHAGFFRWRGVGE